MKKGSVKIFLYDLDIPFLIKDINHPVGGAAVESLNWLKGFKEAGFNISLLTWKGSKEFTKKATIKTYETFYLNKGIPKLRYLFYRIPILFLTIIKNKPDFLIQECAGMNTGILAIICKLLNIKFIYRVASDIDIDKRINKNISFRAYLFYRIGIHLTPIISCQNEYQYENAKNSYPKKTVFKIYNPIFIPKDISVIPKYRRKYIAWVGNLTYVKNLTCLAYVAEQIPDIEFKIAGMETNRTNEVTKKALKKLKTLPNVQFMGYLNRIEIGSFLSNALILLNTSFFEGFSNTFLESWVAGTPVITTINANPDDIITKNKLGYVSNTFQNIPDKIERIKNLSDNDYFKMATNCQLYVRREHDPKKLAVKYYENIIN